MQGLASAAARGAVLLDASSSSTSDLAALGLQLGGGGERQLWLANLTAQRMTVAVNEQVPATAPALVEVVRPDGTLKSAQAVPSRCNIHHTLG